jgi:hypothetical protein
MAKQKTEPKRQADSSSQVEDGKTEPLKAIPIFGREDQDSDEERAFGWFKKPSEIAYGRDEVDAEVLRARVLRLLKTMQSLIDDAPEEVGKFSVDSLTFSVEISAKGSVSILGTGGEVAGRGGITVTLKRSKGATKD